MYLYNDSNDDHQSKVSLFSSLFVVVSSNLMPANIIIKPCMVTTCAKIRDVYFYNVLSSLLTKPL